MSLKSLLRSLVAVAVVAGLLALVGVQPASAGTFDVTVSSPDDDATAGTLRWAIDQANGAGAVPHEIRFNFAAPTTITLDDCSGGGGDLDYTETGTLTLTNLTSNNVMIQQTCAGERVLELSTSSLVVNGGPGRITFFGGQRDRIGSSAKGGNIRVSSGTAHLNDVRLANGRVSTDGAEGKSAQGGGIYASGDVTVTRSDISGGVAVNIHGGQAHGGGISSGGSVVVLDSEIGGNTADSLLNTDVDQTRGGGIYADGSVTVTSSVVSGNRVTNRNNDSARGGGIFGTMVQVTDSTMRFNVATGEGDVGQGGAIYARSSGVTVIRSEIAKNAATSTSSSGAGGGIATDGPISVTNSTVSGNTASGTSDEGGGIWSNAGSVGAGVVTLTFSTIISNEGGKAANVYARKTRIDGTGTIIADPRGGGENCRVDGDEGPNQTSYFWSDDTSCNLDGIGDVENVGGDLPVVAAAAVNGAVNGTENHLPDVASSTSDEIINSAPCGGVTEDQRAVVRPQGSDCDKGSVELKGLSAVDDTAFTTTDFVGHPVTTTVLANDNLGESGGMVTVTISVQPVLGFATANLDNTTTYIPLPVITTVEEYTYEVCGPVNCDTAKVKVTVNGPPVPEFPEQPETSPTGGPEVAPTSAPRPPAKKSGTPAKAAPAGKTTAPKYTG